MRKTRVALVAVVGLLIPMVAPAQGTLQVSNLGHTPTASAAIGSDSWIAQMFETGANSAGYSLGSIQLMMNGVSGNPSGFSVSVYSRSGNGTLGTSLGGLIGSDPGTGGTFTYNASSITLLPSTDYFVVVTAATPVAQGAYSWSAEIGYITTNPNTGWIIQNLYYSSANGSSWAGTIRGDVFQMAIYATPVPAVRAGTRRFISGGFELLALPAKEMNARFQYDGFTTLQIVQTNISANVTYHIKIAIADYRDARLDSAVFIKAACR